MNLKILKLYKVKWATDIQWQPSYLYGAPAAIWWQKLAVNLFKYQDCAKASWHTLIFHNKLECLSLSVTSTLV